MKWLLSNILYISFSQTFFCHFPVVLVVGKKHTITYLRSFFLSKLYFKCFFYDSQYHCKHYICIFVSWCWVIRKNNNFWWTFSGLSKLGNGVYSSNKTTIHRACLREWLKDRLQKTTLYIHETRKPNLTSSLIFFIYRTRGLAYMFLTLKTLRVLEYHRSKVLYPFKPILHGFRGPPVVPIDTLGVRGSFILFLGDHRAIEVKNPWSSLWNRRNLF